MVSAKRSLSLCAVLTAAALLMLSHACGSSNPGISQAQAQAISHGVITAAEAALTGAFAGGSAAERAHPSLATVVKDLQPDQLPGCTTTGTTTTCDLQVNYSGSCPDGGTIGVAGTLDFTLNSGSGSDASTFKITPTNCAVQSGLTINGDPYVQLSTTVNFTNDQIKYPVTLDETGGISYGPRPSGSCTLNVSYTVSSPTSCTVTGTLCGQSLSGSC